MPKIFDTFRPLDEVATWDFKNEPRFEARGGLRYVWVLCVVDTGDDKQFVTPCRLFTETKTLAVPDTYGDAKYHIYSWRPIPKQIEFLNLPGR